MIREQENMKELLCILGELHTMEERLSKIRQGLPTMDVIATEKTIARLMAEGIQTYHQLDDILDQE